MTIRSRAASFAAADRGLFAGAAVLVGWAIQIRDGFYDPLALACLCLAIIAATAALTRLGSRLFARAGEPFVTIVLGAGLIASLLMLAVAKPGYDLRDPIPAHHPWYLAGLAASGVLIGLIAIDARRRHRVWFPALLVTFGMLGVWLLRESPQPRVDVITVQQYAVDAVTEGRSPYSMSFPNVYSSGDMESFYAPGSVHGGRVRFGFPYPPLSLLMVIPAELVLKDLRYTQLLSLIAAAAAIGYVTRGRVAPLAAALLLFTPRTFFVLEQGWTETFALCWLAATVFAAARRWDNRSVLLGLLAAVKQYMAIALIFTSWLNDDPDDRSETMRRLWRALIVAAVVTLPFVLIDPPGFWRSAVVLQLREPFRTDSLSVLSYFAHLGWTVPRLIQAAASLCALAAGLVLSLRFAPRTPGGVAVALGFTFLLMFAFSKKAFCNYYFFVIGALAAAIAAESAADAPAIPDRPPALPRCLS